MGVHPQELSPLVIFHLHDVVDGLHAVIFAALHHLVRVSSERLKLNKCILKLPTSGSK
jgi:hypothetical protein